MSYLEEKKRFDLIKRIKRNSDENENQMRKDEMDFMEIPHSQDLLRCLVEVTLTDNICCWFEDLMRIKMKS